GREPRPRARPPSRPEVVDRHIGPRLARGGGRAGGGRRLSFSRTGVPHGHPPLARARAARPGARDRDRRARPAGDRDRRGDARAAPRAARRGRVRGGGDPGPVGRRRPSGNRPEDGAGGESMNDTMVRAIDASGAEIVTVAVRRVDLDRTRETGVLYHLDPKRYFLLANTAGCATAEDAVRYARLAREAGFNEFVKLEVIGDQETL